MHLACAAQTREQPKGPIQPQHFGRTKWSAPILKGSPSIDTFAVKHPYQPVGNGSRNHDIKKKEEQEQTKNNFKIWCIPIAPLGRKKRCCYYKCKIDENRATYWFGAKRGAPTTTGMFLNFRNVSDFVNSTCSNFRASRSIRTMRSCPAIGEFVLFHKRQRCLICEVRNMQICTAIGAMGLRCLKLLVI